MFVSSFQRQRFSVWKFHLHRRNRLQGECVRCTWNSSSKMRPLECGNSGCSATPPHLILCGHVLPVQQYRGARVQVLLSITKTPTVQNTFLVSKISGDIVVLVEKKKHTRKGFNHSGKGGGEQYFYRLLQPENGFSSRSFDLKLSL